VAVATPAPERQASRRKLAKKKQALPDGSFPMPNTSYLKKAIRAVGRAKPGKRPALAKLIRKRARQLGTAGSKVLKGSWADNSQSAKAMANALATELREFASTHPDAGYDEVRIRREANEYANAVTAEIVQFVRTSGKSTRTVEFAGSGGHWVGLGRGKGWKYVKADGSPFAISEKHHLIDHMVETHGVSRSMLERGGGAGGSSRTLKSLHSAHEVFNNGDKKDRKPPEHGMDPAKLREPNVNDRVNVSGIKGTEGQLVSKKRGLGRIKRDDGKVYEASLKDIAHGEGTLTERSNAEYEAMMSKRRADRSGSAHVDARAARAEAVGQAKRKAMGLDPLPTPATDRMNAERAASAKATRGGAASTTVQKTPHAQLLQERKDARAKYPQGHPERLKAERAVRQSRKAGKA
jgi:hypothetical protein